MKPEELRRYAELIVRGCIAFRRGDTLLELVEPRPSRPRRRDRRGRLPGRARSPSTSRTRTAASTPRGSQHAPKEALGHQTPWRRRAVARVRRGDGRDRAGDGRVRARRACADLSPERVAADSGRPQPARRADPRARRRLRGTICAWPTDDWAARVFPELDASEGEAPAREGPALVLPARPRRTRRGTRAGRSISPRCAGARRALTKLDLKEVHVHRRGTDLRAEDRAVLAAGAAAARRTTGGARSR